LLDSYFKIAHILFFALWLGPTLGAYWILISLGKKLTPMDQISLEKSFARVVMFQHFAFVILLATGLTIAYLRGILFQIHWLNIKLFFVAGLVILEGVDIWISHFLFKKSLPHNPNEKNSKWNSYIIFRKKYNIVSGLLLMLLISGVLFFAVIKS
jgi:hypothetical protein